MRKGLDDLFAQMSNANDTELAAFYNNVAHTIEVLRENYRPATAEGREVVLQKCREVAEDMWQSGDRAAALGLGLNALNIEAEFLPDSDAAHVKAETDKVIATATAFSQRS
jgi:hypothetical protein